MDDNIRRNLIESSINIKFNRSENMVRSEKYGSSKQTEARRYSCSFKQNNTGTIGLSFEETKNNREKTWRTTHRRQYFDGRCNNRCT